MRVVVVGGGYAGVLCALRVARLGGADVDVTLVNASETFVERVRLHEFAAGASDVAPSLASLLEGTRVRFMLGQVDRVDLAARTVRIADRALPWDRLVLAVGSHDDLDRIPGARAHVMRLAGSDVMQSAATLHAIAERRGRVVVLGAGLTGLEIATELAESHPGLHIELIASGPMGAGLSRGAQQHIRRVLDQHGIGTREYIRVRRVEAGRLFTEQGEIAFDACLWAAGFVAPRLAQAAGLSVNSCGQAWVDDNLRAIDHPNVYVIGDAAKQAGAFGVHVPMGCKSALPMGTYAANAIVAEARGRPHRKAFAFRAPLYCVSLGRRDGIVQLRPDAGPNAPHLHGVVAAHIKARIVEATLWPFRYERWRALPFFGARSLALPREAAQDGAHG